VAPGARFRKRTKAEKSKKIKKFLFFYFFQTWRAASYAGGKGNSLNKLRQKLSIFLTNNNFSSANNVEASASALSSTIDISSI
jgi:hypothetical protein